jgi:hypothetical protein
MGIGERDGRDQTIDRGGSGLEARPCRRGHSAGSRPILCRVLYRTDRWVHPNDAAFHWGTRPPLPPVITCARNDSNLVNDLHKLATSILDDPPDIATHPRFRRKGLEVGGHVD